MSNIRISAFILAAVILGTAHVTLAQVAAEKPKTMLDVVIALLKHQNLRDIAFVSRTLDIPLSGAPKSYTSLYNQNCPIRTRYPNDNNDISSFNVLEGEKNGIGAAYVVQVHGDQQPKPDTDAVGAVLAIGKKSPEACIRVNDFRTLLKEIGMVEAPATSGMSPGLQMIEFAPANASAVDSRVFVHNPGFDPSANECADSVTFMEIEHRFTPRGELEFNDRHKKSKSEDTPEKTALLEKIEKLLSHANFRDVNFVSGLFGLSVGHQEMKGGPDTNRSSSDLSTYYTAFKAPADGMKLTYGVQVKNDPPNANTPVNAILNIEQIPAGICVTTDDLHQLLKSDGAPATDNKSLATRFVHVEPQSDRYVFSQDSNPQVKTTVSIGVNVERGGLYHTPASTEGGDTIPYSMVDGDKLANVEPGVIPAYIKPGDIFEHNPCATAITFEEIDRRTLKPEEK